MLQQTQVKTVIPYFIKWMERFPSISDLAEAPLESVLKAWEGLGYYRRARHLHQAAKLVVQKHRGIFPEAFEEILALPGIGRYTAGAIASIAFRQPRPIVDGNVERVLSRLFAFDSPLDTGEAKKWFWEKAGILIRKEVPPKESPGAFNEALMELGATVCTPALPLCGKCPLKKNCLAFRRKLVLRLPMAGKPKRSKKILMVSGILSLTQKNETLFFIRMRNREEWSGGLWEFPSFRLLPDEDPAPALEKQFFQEWGFPVKATKKVVVISHTVTTNRITLQVWMLEWKKGTAAKSPLKVGKSGRKEKSMEWAYSTALRNKPFPAPQEKIRQLILTNPN